MPTPSENIAASRERIRRDMESLRRFTDRRFAFFLDFVARSVWSDLTDMLGTLDKTKDGNIRRSGANIRKQRAFMLRAQQIYADALEAIRLKDPRFYAPFTKTAEAALHEVARLSRRMGDEILFPEINLAAVEKA